MREKCLHSQCVCVCVCITGFLVQHSIVQWFEYFKSRTKMFRSGTIYFRTFAKNFAFPLKILVQALHIE